MEVASGRADLPARSCPQAILGPDLRFKHKGKKRDSVPIANVPKGNRHHMLLGLFLSLLSLAQRP